RAVLVRPRGQDPLLRGIARFDGYLLDAPGSERGDVANVLRLEGARRVDVTRHHPFFHGVEPESAALHRRRRRLQLANTDRDSNDCDDADADGDVSLGFFRRCALDIQSAISCREVEGGVRNPTRQPRERPCRTLTCPKPHCSKYLERNLTVEMRACLAVFGIECPETEQS